MTVKVREEFVIQRQGKQYVLFAGLLEGFHTEYDGLSKGIDTQLLQVNSPENGNRAIVKATATVWDADGNKMLEFNGIGDANPNTKGAGKAEQDAPIRMAETRAKARALRDLLNITDFEVDDTSDGDNNNGSERRITRTLAEQINDLSFKKYEGGIEEMKAEQLDGRKVGSLTMQQGQDLLEALRSMPDI